MTTNRLESATVEFPSELQIVLTRDFAAPIALVFDVLTTEEHMRKTIAPYGEEVRLCTVDRRVGGDYHYIFVTEDGTEMSFRGTLLEVDPPIHSTQTWIYDGWPGVEAVESFDLEENDGVTTMKWTLTFADLAGRHHMGTTFDGVQANFDNVAAYLRTLLEGDAADL